MNTYHNTKIYKIINTVNDAFYVGSTVRPNLEHRLMEHKVKARNYPDRKLYKELLSVGWDNVKIELIIEQSCNDKHEKKALERHYVLLLNPTLNIRTPSAVSVDVKLNNNNSVKAWKKEHYQENKETILIQKAEFIMCDICHKEYMRRHKNAHIKTKYHLKHIID